MNIRLEKFSANDFSHYFSLVSNEKVMAMITERAIQEDEAEMDFKKILENNSLLPHFGNFKILDASSERFIGLAKLEIKEDDMTKAELGYMILPEYWGKRIASFVAKQLIQIAISQKVLRKLFAIIDPKNIPSRKVLVNNGFVSKEFKDFDGLPGEILELRMKN